jgi:hypothetical protein
VDKSLVAELPDFDRLNPPKKKKKKTNEDEVADAGGDTAEDQGNKGAEKEKRSKKRNERPPASSRLKIKKQKIVGFASSKAVKKSSKASKGTTSKTKMTSIPEAQTQIPPIPDIDVSQPISMILPGAQPEKVNVSSNSEDTLSDSTLQELMNAAPKPKARLAYEDQEAVSNDNSVLNQLSFHISSDAFTSSRLNSPADPINDAIPMHIDTETTTTSTIPQTIEPQESHSRSGKCTSLSSSNNSHSRCLE